MYPVGTYMQYTCKVHETTCILCTPLDTETGVDVISKPHAKYSYTPRELSIIPKDYFP